METPRVLARTGYADSDLDKTFEELFDVHVEVNFVSLPEKFLAP